MILNSFANIIDGDAIDDLDISGNNVDLTAGGSIGGTSSDVFKGVFDPIEVNATGNLTATATTGAIALDANVQGTVSLSSITAYIESDGNLIAAPSVHRHQLSSHRRRRPQWHRNVDVGKYAERRW